MVTTPTVADVLEKAAEHTPGPWATNGGIVRTADENNLTVKRIASISGAFGDPEKIANALLIAAAPDMAAALAGVMDILGRAESNASGNPEWSYVGPRVIAARAAIAKALGK